LGFRWLDRLQVAMPDLNIRAELGMPDRLTRFLIEGVMQVGLLYMPQLRPGLEAKRLMDEDLVLVSSVAGATMDSVAENYVFVDWGPEFVGAHALALPDLTNPGMSFVLGAMVAEYVINRRASAYLPARYVKKYIDSGQMHLVPDAPRFPYPVWAVWREDLDPDLRRLAEAELTATVVVADDDSSAVIDQLRDITDGDTVDILGEVADE
jgi:DNA-binding transcriptional LysR family regulator